MREDAGTVEFVDDFLSHFGVKGMRWGQRMSEIRSNRAAKKTAKADKKFEEKANSVNTKIALHNAAAERMNSYHIPHINGKPEYVKAADDGTLMNADHPTTKKYYKEFNDAYIREMNTAASTMTNKSGTKHYSVSEGSDHFLGFNVTAKDIKHSSETFSVKYEKDDKGRITGVVLDTMAQGAIATEEVLAHYGVKGMRWGQRSVRTPVSVTQKGKKLRAKGGQAQPAHKDAIRKATVARQKKKSGTNSLSDADLKAYANRLELEQRVSRLEAQTKNPARRFVTNLLVNTGKNAAQQAANEAASKQVKKIMNSEGKKK